MKKWTVALFTLLALASCESTAEGEETNKQNPAHHPTGIKAVDDPKMTWVEEVENAHGKAAFLQHDSIAFDIELFFGGSKRLDATMTLATNSSGGHYAMRDSTFINFHGNEVEHDTAKSEASARFAAYTWSYFFLYPYKMSDPGTMWENYPDSSLGDENFDAQKLTFAPGTGDAPDDWYISYVDEKSKLTEVAAYIVTAGGTVEEAEQDPHAIRYHDYQEIGGIPIATRWSFWAWREGKGLTEELGSAKLTNFRFIN